MTVRLGDDTLVAAYTLSIKTHIYRCGPGMRSAKKCEALTLDGAPRIEFLLALASTLEDLENRHARN
jgi:hypothetical protein